MVCLVGVSRPNRRRAEKNISELSKPDRIIGILATERPMTKIVSPVATGLVLLAAVLLTAPFCGDLIRPTAAAPDVPARAIPPPSLTASAAPAFPTQTRTRGELLLDGEWRFAPALSPLANAAETPTPPPNDPSWGAIRVPGSWIRRGDIARAGTGPGWADLTRENDSGKADAPSHGTSGKSRFLPTGQAARWRWTWNGSARTPGCTWDGERVGEVHWPGGEIDLTSRVKPGQRHTLSVKVVAAKAAGDVPVLMGIAPGQNSTRKAELLSAGLIGHVRLFSRPATAHIDAVFVTVLHPRTRSDGGPGPEGDAPGLRVSAGDGGSVGRNGQGRAVVSGPRRHRDGYAGDRDCHLALGEPAPLGLRAAEPVRAPGVRDRAGQPERRIYPAVRVPRVLGQGTRPLLEWHEIPYAPDSASPTTGRKRTPSRNWIPTAITSGSCGPATFWERGNPADAIRWYEIADRHGLPISGILPHMGWLGGEVDGPEKSAAFEAAARRDLRRYRNHPSIVMWGSSGNMMGATLDPARIGNRKPAWDFDVKRSPNLARAFPLGQRGIEILKRLDPTRPAFIHFGGPVGDVYTLNCYLNLLPLQEREEWLSEWASSGDMPLWMVEFGTPLSISFLRGRDNFGNSLATEPFLTEYCAIYQGPDAYTGEDPEYRANVAAFYQGDNKYRWWIYEKSFNRNPAFLKLQALFLRNTWRSWRTQGMSGGMIPWDRGYISFDGQQTVAGAALASANAPTLAWVCGPAERFTAKDHTFAPGQRVRKQVALLNDTRAPQEATAHWTVTVDGKPVARGQAGPFRLAVGETRFAPIEFTAPALTAKADGEIVMEATVGSAAHTDHFAFRVLPAGDVRVAAAPVLLWDPAGRTTALIKRLGLRAVAWDGKPAPGHLLVVGSGRIVRDTPRRPGCPRAGRGMGIGDGTNARHAAPPRLPGIPERRPARIPDCALAPRVRRVRRRRPAGLGRGK